MSDREVRVIAEDGDDVILEMPIGAVPRGEFSGFDKNGASTYGMKYPSRVLSISEDSRKAEFQESVLFTEEFDCECREVKVGPFTAIVSSNESLAVFDHNTGDIRKAKPDDSLGAFIPILSRDPRQGTEGDKELGWFIGMLVSKGWLRNNVLGMSKLEDVKREAFIRIAREKITSNILVKEYRGAEEDCQMHMNSPELTEIVRSWCIYKGREGGLYKTIPSRFLHNGSRECLLGILSGLIDGAGALVVNTIRKNKRFTAKINTSSEYLVEDLKTLMFRLGMRWSLTVNPLRNHSKVSHSFFCSTIDMREVLDGLYLTGRRECEVRTEWLSSDVHRDLAQVPVTRDELKLMRRVFLDEKLRTPYTSLKNIDRPYVTRHFLSKYGEYIKGYVPQVMSRAFSEVLWMPLEGVTDGGTRDVYDLEVPATKIFSINGGLLIWDTASYAVPVSSAAVKEAISKMMPERNLMTVRDRTPTYVPSAEYAQGLYLATKDPDMKPPQRFRTREDAYAAYRKGALKIDDPVIILE